MTDKPTRIPGDTFTDEDREYIVTGHDRVARRAVDSIDALRAEVYYLRLAARTPPPTIPMGRPVCRIDDAIMVASPDFIFRADHEREVREACLACVLGAGDPADQQWEHGGPGPWWEAHVDRVLAERAKKAGPQ